MHWIGDHLFDIIGGLFALCAGIGVIALIWAGISGLVSSIKKRPKKEPTAAAIKAKDENRKAIREIFEIIGEVILICAIALLLAKFYHRATGRPDYEDEETGIYYDSNRPDKY